MMKKYWNIEIYLLFLAVFFGASCTNNDFVDMDNNIPSTIPEEQVTSFTPSPEPQNSISPGTDTPQPADITPNQDVVPAESHMIFLLDNEIVRINPYNPMEIDYLIQNYQSDFLLNPKPEELSPDGTKLLINTINAEVGKYRLVILDLQSQSVLPLMNESADQIYPSWSPAGEHIVLTLRSEDASTVCIVTQDGSSLKRLDGGYAWDRRPLWSPDGNRIYYLSSKNNDVYPLSDIFVINADGTNNQKLTSMPYEITDFSLSPDGSRIAFSAPLHNQDIYILSTDGSKLVNITENIYQDTSPVWFPDSSKLAFRSNRDGDWEVYTMDSSGNNVERITNSPGLDAPILWSPLGDYLAILSDRSGSNQVFALFVKENIIQQITYSEDYPYLADIWVPHDILQ